ncbi:MAG: tRNA (adenosine(37)-N6)-dimethylallyltransferase MiaA, partial [Candidatus Brocadiia bacterium]|nr:tRNA (adenosine(37)-N6)-dimethylallyltransferase MiaA [Candidatus Brocadiia bacterium]
MGQTLLAIVGPTAAGKSALALRLALRHGGEIVSADSRQVYRLMDIGTAKPAPEELSAVPHHLIDAVDPDEPFSLAMFLEQARAAIADIAARSRLPILVGGTGQWVWALLEGWEVPAVAPDTRLRANLEERARQEGHEALYAELSRTDPAAAARIDARNVRRVVRALEIAAVGGTPPGKDTPDKTSPPFDARLIGLTLERGELYRRIDDRVDSMIERGWVGEVSGLLERGYGPELPSMSGLGYGDLARHVRGELDLDAAVELIKFGTHRFARSQ